MFYKYHFILSYQKILNYDCLNKFYYLSFDKLPKIKKITLSFKLKVFNLKKIAVHYLTLKYLNENKNHGIFLKANKPNLLLKIKKGNPIGCEFHLKKNKLVILFLTQLIINILLIAKTTSVSISKNFCFFKINDIMLTPKFEKFFNIFNTLNALNVIINFKAKKNEIYYMIYNFKISN